MGQACKLKPVGVLLTAVVDAARELKKTRYALLFAYHGSIAWNRLVVPRKARKWRSLCARSTPWIWLLKVQRHSPKSRGILSQPMRDRFFDISFDDGTSRRVWVSQASPLEIDMLEAAILHGVPECRPNASEEQPGLTKEAMLDRIDIERVARRGR